MYAFKEILVLSVAFALCQGVNVELVNSRMERIYGPVNTYYIYTGTSRNSVSAKSAEIIAGTTILPLGAGEGTAIVVHGASGSIHSTMNSWLVNAFLGHDLDVIVLDWEHVASFTASIETAMDSVAKNVAEVIEHLETLGSVSLDSLHLVGFGLGAHLVGMIGRELDGQAARITGLDPSGGTWATSSRCLARTDAKYVEVLHTDGSGSRANGIGVAIGHIDIFANGGTSQPGCSNNLCNHERAWELFSASLTHGGLIAFYCNDMTEVSRNRCTGFNLDIGTSELVKHGPDGLYRVNTGRAYPYIS